MSAHIEYEKELDLSLVADPPTNPNSMSPRDYDALVHLIREEGFLQPILVQKLGSMYQIVDGVHRTRGAREVGLTHVPALVLPPDYPEAKVSLLQIGMNRLRGDLDHTAVAQTLAELGDNWDLSLSGFATSEISAMLEAIKPPSLEDFADEGMEAETLTPETASPAFVLEIEFASADTLKAAKKALKKAGGAGNKSLAVGLVAALGIGAD